MTTALEQRELQEKLLGPGLPTLKLNRNVQRFFEISPIHSCSYIGFHKAIYEAVFWACIACISIGLCVNDVTALLAKYSAQATAVSVLFKRNNTISFPDAAICFDVFRDDLQKSINATFVEANFNHSLDYVYEKLISTAIGSTALMTIPATMLTDTDVDLVMKTTYLLVAAIVDYDLGTPGGGNSGYWSGTVRAVELVDNFFIGHGYNYAILYEQTARFMCNQALMGITAAEPNTCAIRDVGSGIQCIDICGTAQVNWVGYTMAFAPFDDLCFALNTATSHLFNSALDSVVLDTVYVERISQLVTDWANGTSKSSKEFILPGYGKPHMNFEMRGWRGLMDPRAMDSLCLIGDTTGFLVGVQIESEFQAYNHTWGKGTCGSLQLADCALFNCLPSTRLASDGCWPLAGYLLNSKNMPLQTPICGRYYTNYEINALNNESTPYMGSWETCIFNTCTFPPCSASIYLFETSYSSHASVGVNATLYQSKLSYAIYTEYVIMNYSSFMASLGGSLGLWIGSSLVSLLHIPVFVVCSIINWYMMRRISKASMSSGGTAAAALEAQLPYAPQTTSLLAGP